MVTVRCARCGKELANLPFAGAATHFYFCDDCQKQNGGVYEWIAKQRENPIKYRRGLRCERCGEPLNDPLATHVVMGSYFCIDCARQKKKELNDAFGALGSAGNKASEATNGMARCIAEIARKAPFASVPAIEKVIRNDRATIILWADGKKTVVKCKGGEAQDDYAGFCACIVKRLYGSSRRAKRMMDEKEGK